MEFGSVVEGGSATGVLLEAIAVAGLRYGNGAAICSQSC